MTFKKLKWLLIPAVIIVLLMCCDKDKNYPVKGQVINAENGQPVEGAVVAVKWKRYKLGPPGLPPNRKRYGTTDFITNAQGQFIIPKYPWGSHYMGVYKKGYVVWSSEKIYNPEGNTHDEKYRSRNWHRVKDGMEIKLIPIPILEHARYDHAAFLDSVRSRVESLKFTEATIKERKFLRKEYRKRWGSDK